MSWLDDLATLALTRDPSIGTLATNVFVRRLPSTAPDACVVFLPYQGRGAVQVLDGTDDPSQSRPRVQARVRGPRNDALSADNKVHDVYAALRNVSGLTSGSTRFFAIEEVAPPFPIGDDDSRPLWVVNFEVTIDE